METYNLYEIHQSNKEVFRHFSIKNQLFVFYNCPQLDKIVSLYTAHNQLVFSIRGKRTFHRGDQEWTITEDTSFMLKRTAFHQEIEDDIKGWEVLAFYIKDDYFKYVLDEYRAFLNFEDLPKPSKEMLLDIYLNDRIRECYLSMLPYFNEGSKHPEGIIEMKFKELLYNIFIHPKNKHILAYVNAISKGYLTPIWEVMENNFMYNLGLPEFAQIANRSLSKFKVDFQDHYKTTPGKWLLNKRLDYAKQTLLTTSKSISETAYDSGFENLTHFSRVFKKRFGQPPSVFRRNGIGY
ncbi:MAG: helix-turn-helix transcriptional regulator [Algicola sp.]|nr:helix-turn-helix transcriptional regulator [Algicola sp.]